MIKKILFSIGLFLISIPVLAATNVPMSNSSYSYSAVKNMGTYYYYDSYIANLSINTAQSTTSSTRWAGRSRTYAYFTSANALRSSNQYTAKMRVCGGSSVFGSYVSEAVPAKIHWAYNTTNSMTGAIDGNINDLIMTYQVVSPQNGCIDFNFIFTPPVDGLRAVGFWVSYSRLSPVSTCWEADCSSEHRQDDVLVDTAESGSSSGIFKVSSFTISYIEGGTSTALIEYNQQLMLQQQQQTNQNLQDIDDTLNNDNTEEEANDFADFFNNFTTDSHGLTGIITAPLNAINSLTSSTCTALELPLPFIPGNNTLSLPCMRPIYQQHFGAFMSLYDTITFGIVAYWVCVRIFGMVKDFKNPEHDEIEVMDL